MIYAKESNESLDTVIAKLEAAVQNNKFGILGVHNLKDKMGEKGIQFGPECRIFEVCNPFQAQKVLEADMSIANALPCRICVYEQAGKVQVSTIRPTFLLDLFQNTQLKDVAMEVEETIKKIIDEACR